MKTADGLRVVLDPMPHSAVVAAGVFVAGGSRLDPTGRSGLGHFLEHAVFRGTRLHDGRALSREIDRRGAQANGYTDKEMTWFEAEGLAADAEFVLDLLGELAFQPLLEPDAVERERSVVLAEADEADDDGEERALDLLEAGLWPHTAGARPVVGLPEEVRAIPAALLAEHHARTYRPDRVVVSMAGRLPPDVDRFLAARLAGPAWLRGEPAGPLPGREESGVRFPAQRSVRELGQVHLAVGHIAPGRREGGAPAALLLAELLGGGPSSRLFEHLREDLGLAYTVYAQAVQYSDRGFVGAYLSCAEEDLPDAVGALCREIRRLGDQGVTAEEVERARGALKGALVFAHESAGARMARMAEEELLGSGAMQPERRLEVLEAVTTEEVAALARGLGADRDGWCWAAVGPVEPDWEPESW